MFSKVLRRSLSSVVRKRNVWNREREVSCPFEDIEIPKMCIQEYVFKNLDRWATKTAVVCGITKREYTYQQVYKQSRILGANLRKKFNIKDGDTIAIMSPNIPEYPIVIYGVLTSGATATPLNPVYTAYEVQKLLEISDTSLIIAYPDVIPVIKKALEMSRKKINIITIDVERGRPNDTVSYKELVDDNNIDMDILKEVKRNYNDLSILPYSSGTTGFPKAVQLTHYGIVANCEQQNTEFRQYTYTTGHHQDNLLAILPLFHSYGLGVVMLHKMSVGIKLVTLPRFQPETFLNALIENKINLLYVAPPIILFLGSHSQVTREHLVYLDRTTCGAAPLPAVDIENFLSKAKPDMDFQQGYGMTEASPLVTLSVKGEKFYESVGYPLPNIRLRVVDQYMKNLGPNEVGELLIQGPNVMKGYKDNPKANKEVFVDGDWFRSGDVAKINETGLVTVTDRFKELIKVKGLQVPPAELENVLKEHPGVLDAAVVGIPDPETGERPRAFVVLKEGVKLDDKCIMEFVKERVAPFKRIKHVTFIDSIPKNPSGKILRKVLKEDYCK